MQAIVIGHARPTIDRSDPQPQATPSPKFQMYRNRTENKIVRFNRDKKKNRKKNSRESTLFFKLRDLCEECYRLQHGVWPCAACRCCISVDEPRSVSIFRTAVLALLLREIHVYPGLMESASGICRTERQVMNTHTAP